MADAGSPPAPRNTLLTLFIFAAALLWGGFSVPGSSLLHLSMLAAVSLATDLLQPRTGRRALQVLSFDAALYAAMLGLPGGAAAVLGLTAAVSGRLRRQRWRDVLRRAAVMAVAGLVGGHAADALLALPGWLGQPLLVVALPVLMLAATALWHRAVLRGWQTAMLAELQAVAAGWLLAYHLAAREWLALALVAGLFIAIRRHMLWRAHTAARNWRLAEQERGWSQGMAAVRRVVKRLDAAVTPQALTAALADGAASLPGVAGVAVWEAPSTGPPRLAAFGRPAPADGAAPNGDQPDAPALAVLTALPPPGVAQALRSGIVHGDRVHYIPVRQGSSVQSVAEISLQPGADTALALHLFSTAVDYFRARLRNLDLLMRSRDDFLATVRVLAATVDARDHYTRRHSENVSVLARRLALEMGLNQDETGDIAMAGLLHDIGKIGIPDSVLTKKGPLDVAERQLMMSHAEVGAAIVMQAEPLVHLAPLVRHHHEWHDGNGYPDGLKGERIPLGAAIIAVADAYDTMTSDRPYRPGVKPEVAMAELQRCAGQQFHPDVVAAAVRLLSRGTLQRPGASDGLLPREADRTLAGRPQHAQFITVRMLQRLAAEMSLVLNLDELLERSLAIIRDEMGFTTGAIVLRDAEGNIALASATGFLSPLIGVTFPPGRGFSRWVIENGQSLRIDDITQDSRYFGQPGSDGVGSELAVPLTVNGHTFGCVIVSSEHKHGFTEQDEELLTAAAGPLAQATHVALLHQSAALPATERDSLTGALNRRTFQRELSAALIQATGAEPRWVAAFDLRGFSRFNRLHGFKAGDAVLEALVRHLDDALGERALIGRLGGDQLMALLPAGTDEHAAAELVEAAVREWTGHKIEVGGAAYKRPPVTGAVAAIPRDLVHADEIMHWGDKFPSLTPAEVRQQLTPTQRPAGY